MSDNIVNIAFDNDAVVDAEGNVVVLTGSFQVDYTTSIAVGNFSFSGPVGAGHGVIQSSGANFQYSNGVYTLTQVGAYLTVSYTGQQPAYAQNLSVGTDDPYTTRGESPQPLTSSVVCFASGTALRVRRGAEIREIAVESLEVGDFAVTAGGEQRPIRWLGHRRIDCLSHPHPHEVMPVRIAAHAFGENRPVRALRVSPGHAIAVDLLGEVLIPASSLINGSTIVQERVENVTYWHVELESHDVLLSENLPTESYLDMGNRAFFMRPSEPIDLYGVPDTTTATHADFCRPFHTAGSVVEFVRSRLAARALELGWEKVENPLADLHLVVDGRRIEAEVQGLSACFLVPATAKTIWLTSETSIPVDIGLPSDLRALGVCIGRLVVDDGFGSPRTIMVDDPRLCVGFHHLEEGPQRWTAGRARLPADLWHGCCGSFFLRVELTRPALARWAHVPSAANAANRQEALAS